MIENDEIYLFCIKNHPDGFFKNCYYSLMRCDDFGDYRKYYISYSNKNIKLREVGSDSELRYSIFYSGENIKSENDVDNYFISVDNWLDRNFPQKLTVRRNFDKSSIYGPSFSFRKNEIYWVDVNHYSTDPLKFNFALMINGGTFNFDMTYEDYLKNFTNLAEIRKKKLRTLEGGENLEYESSRIIKLNVRKIQRRKKLNKIKDKIDERDSEKS